MSVGFFLSQQSSCSRLAEHVRLAKLLVVHIFVCHLTQGSTQLRCVDFQGILIGLANLDGVVKVIRRAKDSAEASEGLQKGYLRFDLIVFHVLHVSWTK